MQPIAPTCRQTGFTHTNLKKQYTMRKKLLPFSLLLLFAVTVLTANLDAQTNNQRIYSEQSGGYYGPDVEWSSADQTYVLTNIDSMSISLSKLDPTGVPLWNKNFSFPDV